MALISDIIKRTKENQREYGLPYALRFDVNILKNLMFYPYYKSAHRGTFLFKNKELGYFNHWYNTTYVNERSIEIPIAVDFIRNHPPERILEIGNVLSHYFPFHHLVIDRYETGGNVKNIDIVRLQLGRQYERIVSISTMEHVGWDDRPQNPGKLSKSIGIIKDHLTPDGKFLMTFPIGYNPVLDDTMDRHEIAFSEVYYYKKDVGNTWFPCEWKDIRDLKGGFPDFAARGIVVGIITKQPGL